MALADGISFVAASSGTGTFVFSAARTSYLTLAQAHTAGTLADGQIVSYLGVDSVSAPTQREWGHGTYSLSGNSIARTTVLGNMNGTTSLISFTVPPVVFLTALAEDILTGVPDALYLTHGLSVLATDPNVSGNPNDAQGVQFQITYDKLITNPGFTDTNGVEITLNYLHGMNTYGTDNGTTVSKTTPIALNVTQYAVGAGEHFAAVFDLFAFGFSDNFCFGGGGVTYAVGPISGDEGVGLTPQEFGMFQLNNIVTYTITSVTRTTFSTTTTQVITGSQNPQTITVASTTGANVGDWIVFNQNLPQSGGGSNLAVAQITAVGAGTITCVCPNNFNSGVTITPALVLGTSGTFQIGEQRVLVNLSGASYSTGQIRSGWPLVGVGTAWSNTMVGGSATNIGALSIDQDIYSDVNAPNFSATPLHSWYQLLGSLTATNLFTYQNTAFAPMAYAGNAVAAAALFTSTCTITLASPAVVTLSAGSAPPAGTAVRFTTTGALPTGITANTPYWVTNPSGATFRLAAKSDGSTAINTSGSQSGTHTVFNGGYTIVPCARVLWISPPGSGGLLICETSTATWNVGDTFECVIAPYSYVQGLNLNFAHWNPGASLVNALELQNSGARQFTAALSIGSSAGSIGRLNSDPVGWGTAIVLGSCGTGLVISAAQTGIHFVSTPVAMTFGNGATIATDSNPGGLNFSNCIAMSQSVSTAPCGITVWSTGGQTAPPSPLAGLDVYLNSATHVGMLVHSFGTAGSNMAQFNGPNLTSGVDQYGTMFCGVSYVKPDSFTNTTGYYAAPTEGMLRMFNDANTGTIGATITAGGSTNHVLGLYKGGNWIVVA